MNQRGSCPDDLDAEQAAFAADLAQRLRNSEQLDFVTTSRLSAARARALDAARRPQSPLWGAFGGGRLALAGAVAVAAVTGALLLHPQAARQPDPAPVAMRGDALDLLLDEQDPQFYEDLEMLVWLDQQHV